MFWTDPNLYGASFNREVTTPLQGPVGFNPWVQNFRVPTPYNFNQIPFQGFTPFTPFNQLPQMGFGMHNYLPQTQFLPQTNLMPPMNYLPQDYFAQYNRTLPQFGYPKPFEPIW